jgi:pentatricopeptide repeat protein
MERSAVRPDVIVRNALISACAKGRQGARALELLNDSRGGRHVSHAELVAASIISKTV